MSNPNETNTATETTGSSAKYSGEKAPMVNMTMLKTSKAITGALNRIAVRKDWIRNQKAELREDFNSTDPVTKQTAFARANHLVASIPSLNEKEEMLKEKLPAVQKEELNEKLAEFASDIDNLEEIFENKEQIEISRYFERLPKSSTIATEELINDELFFRDPEGKDDSISNE